MMESMGYLDLELGNPVFEMLLHNGVAQVKGNVVAACSTKSGTEQDQGNANPNSEKCSGKD